MFLLCLQYARNCIIRMFPALGISCSFILTDNYLIMPSGNLQIVNASQDDEGTYKCAAYNPITQEVKTSVSSEKLRVRRKSLLPNIWVHWLQAVLRWWSHFAGATKCSPFLSCMFYTSPSYLKACFLFRSVKFKVSSCSAGSRSLSHKHKASLYIFCCFWYYIWSDEVVDGRVGEIPVGETACLVAFSPQ